MPMLRRLVPLGLLLTLVLAAAGCGGSDAATAPPATATPLSSGEGRTPIEIATKSGKRPVVYAELALTPQEANVGLSKRDSLPPDAGMLFLLPFRGPGFWMKDTTIPLTVAFIAPCGEIVATADMTPLSEQLHNTHLEYRFGLEVNQGWFERNGVEVGDKVTIPPNLSQPECR